jgi:hypothetical protein
VEKINLAKNCLIFTNLLAQKTNMPVQRFNDEELSKPEKAMVRMRSITNYVMGSILIGCGLMVFFPPASIVKFIERYDDLAIKMLGIICIIYGAFRVYRGYMKNYFRES